MTTNASFEPHGVRGPFNAWFFNAFDGYIDLNLRRQKRRVFAELPSKVVEVGSGVGANLRYLAPGTNLVAVEPNPHMHARLRRNASKHGIDLEIRALAGESLDLADGSADAVITSLLLCTVSDPVRVVREIRRVLRPGGRYAFVEHVAAPDGFVRGVQHAVRRP
ncbi:MAG: class I SAM-dependent methyltransferase [Nocardioidaceae bacterium]